MFLEDQIPEYPSALQYLVLDVDVRQGAQVASLTVPPDENANAGPGTLRVRLPDGAVQPLPWNLSSTVARSPLAGFEVRMVHAADAPFTARSLAEQLAAPGVECLEDPSKCEFVEEALALDRIYLGFFNVTRSGALVGADLPAGGAYSCGDPMTEDTFCVPTPPAGPYFVMRLGGEVASDADLAGISVHGIPVPYLAEPTRGAAVGALLIALALRRQARVYRLASSSLRGTYPRMNVSAKRLRS